jgi:hypothetical protein
MVLPWLAIGKASWYVLWRSTVYSYLCCGAVALFEGYRTKGDKVKIDAAIERFIISPFYVATLFVLVAMLFYTQGVGLVRATHAPALWTLIVLAVSLFSAQLLLEILESTFIQHDMFRLLKDVDAMRLFATAAVTYVFLVIVAFRTC